MSDKQEIEYRKHLLSEIRKYTSDMFGGPYMSVRQLEDYLRKLKEKPMRNVIPRKMVSTRTLKGQTYYYAGITLYPSKAKLVSQELKEKGIGSIVTWRRDIGAMLWADKPIWVDLSEPIYARNPNITEESKRVFMDYARDAINWSGSPMVGGNVGGSKEERGNITQLKIAGLIKTQVDEGYTWIFFTPLGKVYAKSLGIDLDWIKNPDMSKALSARQRYQEDLKAGHSGAAEYWRGQAGAYFTGNPRRKIKPVEYFIAWVEDDGKPHYEGPFDSREEAEDDLKRGQVRYGSGLTGGFTSAQYPSDADIVTGDEPYPLKDNPIGFGSAVVAGAGLGIGQMIIKGLLK